MKLIMESWKKYINETRADDELDRGYRDAMEGEVRDPSGSNWYQDGYDEGEERLKRERKTPEQIAAEKAVKLIKYNYNEKDFHEMVYEDLEDLVVNTYADHHPEEGLPDAEEVEAMMKELGIFEPEEEYDDLASDDYEDPPGYMPGEDRKWK
jgi:hypothetical protein